jgi:hypothetical protein
VDAISGLRVAGLRHVHNRHPSTDHPQPQPSEAGTPVQTQISKRPFKESASISVESDLLRDPVKAPSLGDALELMLAGILECDPRTGRKVTHGL